MGQPLLTGTFTDYAGLEMLPRLVRQQRTLARRLADMAQDEKDEKAVRVEILALLEAAGIKAKGSVTCIGYEVIHSTRAGQSWISPELVLELLVAAGVERELVAEVITKATVDGTPSKFATVRPEKGAKVRQVRE